jgi:hypothetical protein
MGRQEDGAAAAQSVAPDHAPAFAGRERIECFLPLPFRNLQVEQGIEWPVGGGFEAEGLAGARLCRQLVAAFGGCHGRAAQAGKLAARQAGQLAPGPFSPGPVIIGFSRARFQQQFQAFVFGMLGGLARQLQRGFRVASLCSQQAFGQRGIRLARFRLAARPGDPARQHEDAGNDPPGCGHDPRQGQNQRHGSARLDRNLFRPDRHGHLSGERISPPAESESRDQHNQKHEEHDDPVHGVLAPPSARARRTASSEFSSVMRRFASSVHPDIAVPAGPSSRLV